MLDIEQPTMLVDYLRDSGRIGADEHPSVRVLAGGVSNRTVLVERDNGESWVLKQALEKLRVQSDWYSDPIRIHREAAGLRYLETIAPPGSTTPLVFEDGLNHIIAMAAVPQPHQNWKSMLLAGDIREGHVEQFATLLGVIHRQSHARATEFAAVFEDRTFFRTLRVEPYYQYTASRHPETAVFFEDLVSQTLDTRLSLVHGDYSPKNILVHQDRLVLLDHEVIHFGDPAFDLGFSLTHLLSKANHLPDRRGELLRLAERYWDRYRETAPAIVQTQNFEVRVIAHTAACLLARVDGRSPLEYLTVEEQQRQRDSAIGLIHSRPFKVEEMIHRLGGD